MSNVRRFGAAGDGKTDDTEAIRHTIRDGDGMLHFPPGNYMITETLEFPLAEVGPVGIDGTGGTARILMTGPGPAIRLRGTHGGTGNPNSVKGNVYPTQRMPMVKNIAIEGAHALADGIQMIQTMQAIVEGVLIRRCRHGIHLFERNRNVLISHSHLNFNTGIGVFLDHVNLHQINIASSHISYNRLGGIRIEGSEVRNLQITGNDIEYNNHEAHKTDPEPTAEIYIDTTEPGASVAEVTIASNTIQATPSPMGSNIRICETDDDNSIKPRLWAISGNIIGNQENNIHLTGCHGMAINGNCIYSCEHRNLLIEDSHHLNLTGNVFRRHTPRLGTGVRIVKSHDIALTGCTIHDEHPEGQPIEASLLELDGCERINVSGCQLLDGVPMGVDAVNCSHCNLTGNTIHDTRSALRSQHAIRFGGSGQGNLVGLNTIGPALEDALDISDSAGVRLHENLIAE